MGVVGSARYVRCPLQLLASCGVVVCRIVGGNRLVSLQQGGGGVMFWHGGSVFPGS